MDINNSNSNEIETSKIHNSNEDIIELTFNLRSLQQLEMQPGTVKWYERSPGLFNLIKDYRFTITKKGEIIGIADQSLEKFLSDKNELIKKINFIFSNPKGKTTLELLDLSYELNRYEPALIAPEKTEVEAKKIYWSYKINIEKELRESIVNFPKDSYDKMLENYILSINPDLDKDSIIKLLDNLKVCVANFLKCSSNEDIYKVLLTLFSVYNRHKRNFETYDAWLRYDKDDRVAATIEFIMKLGSLYNDLHKDLYAEYFYMDSIEIHDFVLHESKILNLIISFNNILRNIIPEKKESFQSTNKVTSRNDKKQEHTFKIKLKVAIEKIKDFLGKMTPHKTKK